MEHVKQIPFHKNDDEKEIGNNFSLVGVMKTVGVKPSVAETKLKFIESGGGGRQRIYWRREDL